MSQLYSYEALRDRINDILNTIQLGVDELSHDDMSSLLKELILERKIMVEEIDELRESRYGWIDHANNSIHSMKLLLSNLDDETYNNLKAKASRLGIEDGRLLNELMKQVIAKPPNGDLPELSSRDISHLKKDTGYITIQHIPELIVTRKDLKDTTYRVKFAHIGKLEFNLDIDKDLFYQKVKNINHCGIISIPTKISKLLVYAKAGYCREYKFI